jgi:hypothetical protein
MPFPDYSLRAMAVRAEARYSFASRDTVADILRYLMTETESRIHTYEVTMIPNDTFPPDHKAAGKIAALAQAAKEKTAETTAAVIEDVSKVAKDVAVATSKVAEKVGDKVVEAGQKILKLI